MLFLTGTQDGNQDSPLHKSEQHLILNLTNSMRFLVNLFSDNVVPMRIVTDGRTCVLELPHGEEAGRFLTELKQACAGQYYNICITSCHDVHLHSYNSLVLTELLLVYVSIFI